MIIVTVISMAKEGDQSEGGLAGLEKKVDSLEGHVGPMSQVAESAEATNCR